MVMVPEDQSPYGDGRAAGSRHGDRSWKLRGLSAHLEPQTGSRGNWEQCMAFKTSKPAPTSYKPYLLSPNTATSKPKMTVPHPNHHQMQDGTAILRSLPARPKTQLCATSSHSVLVCATWLGLALPVVGMAVLVLCVLLNERERGCYHQTPYKC